MAALREVDEPGSSVTVDRTLGSGMWHDVVPNKDVTGWKLPKAASPCYLLLSKGDFEMPHGGITEEERRNFQKFTVEQMERNPVGVPWKAIAQQTLPDTWYPHKNAQFLLIYYMPWRKHHHDPSVGNYLTWSAHLSDRNASMQCANDLASSLPTSQIEVLPLPQQEIVLIKRALDLYFFTLRKQGLTVDAPSVHQDYLWSCFWNDETVEQACSFPVACSALTSNGATVKGRKQASQCAYYLFSQVRHQVAYPADSDIGPPQGLEFYKMFNRINVLATEPQVVWGKHWHELQRSTDFAGWYQSVSWHQATADQLRSGMGGVAHLSQRLQGMTVQLQQAEQALQATKELQALQVDAMERQELIELRELQEEQEGQLVTVAKEKQELQEELRYLQQQLQKAIAEKREVLTAQQAEMEATEVSANENASKELALLQEELKATQDYHTGKQEELERELRSAKEVAVKITEEKKAAELRVHVLEKELASKMEAGSAKSVVGPGPARKSRPKRLPACKQPEPKPKLPETSISLAFAEQARVPLLLRADRGQARASFMHRVSVSCQRPGGCGGDLRGDRRDCREARLCQGHA